LPGKRTLPITPSTLRVQWFDRAAGNWLKNILELIRDFALEVWNFRCLCRSSGIPEMRPFAPRGPAFVLRFRQLPVRFPPVSTSTRATASETASAGTEKSRRPAFVTTHWSVVLTAARSDTTRARAALECLCRAYWFPLYAYVRRRGYSPEDAEDLTQEFFARLLERHRVASVAPEKGRFRSFLLASMNHFLADEWDKARAQKRGGGRVISLDLQTAETRLEQPAANELTAEEAFDRKWALALLEQVYWRLEEEHRQQAKADLFAALRATLAGAGNAAPYAELARQLNLSEGAVKVAVHRLRHRYRELLRETIADTVDQPDEVEEELRYLLRTLAG
jgi:RNA polymerase sigma factor (sigma-70 family)